MEDWNDGMMEDWNDGMMESWNDEGFGLSSFLQDAIEVQY